MSVSFYQRARSETAELLGYDLTALTPSQTLRLDCATALRLALDGLQGAVVRGESIDVAKMLTASEALSRLLPPAVLATPPAEQHGDPRVVMWEIYSRMRQRGEIDLKPPDGERVAQLEEENERLRAQLGGGHAPALPDVAASKAAHVQVIDPRTSDIVPPSEIGECHVGMKAGPDDPPRPRVIEGKAVREAAKTAHAQDPAAAAPRQPSWDSSAHAAAWRAWRGAVRPDPWSNNNT